MLIWLPRHQLNLVLHAQGQGNKLGQGHHKVKVIPGSNCKCLNYYWQLGGEPLTRRHSCSENVQSERGYNPETPCNFSYQSSMMPTRWHAHLRYDWWGLPSGEAALALPCWQAPRNSSLDWTIVGVTLGPDSEVSVWVLGTQCWGYH